MLHFIIAVFIVYWILKAVFTAIGQTAAQLRARKENLAYMRRQAELGRLAALRRRDAEEKERQRQALLQADLEIVRQQRQALAIQQETRRQQAQLERDRKAEEKARKAAFERQQAEEDLEHYAAIREGYLDLMAELELELKASYTTEKRRNTIRRQLLALEEKMYKIDQKRARAYYLANEKGA